MRYFGVYILLYLTAQPSWQMNTLSVVPDPEDLDYLENLNYLEEFRQNVPKKPKTWNKAIKALIDIVLRQASDQEEQPAPEEQIEEYVGCFKDAEERAMGGGYIRHDREPVTMCIEQCRREGTTYAAIQDATACFCANKYDMYGAADASECNSPCSGLPGKCGGAWRNSVWKIAQEVPEAAIITETDLGCFKDSATRAMPGGYVRLDAATMEKCIARCRGKGTRFAALQDASACFCANVYAGQGSALQSECSSPCPGNPAEKCGGPWRNNVWQID